MTAEGYVRVLLARGHPLYEGMACFDGYVLEHRLAMAEHLGRPLLRSETVHHIDGNKQNNARTNLEVRQGNHGKGIVLRCLDCGAHDVGAVELAATPEFS